MAVPPDLDENEPRAKVFLTHGELPKQTPAHIRCRLILAGSFFPSMLKRTKRCDLLEDVRPTLRNKPSGLRPEWHRTVSRSSTPRKQAPPSGPPPSSSLTSMSSVSASPTIPRSRSPDLELDHTSSLLAMSPPSPSQMFLPLSHRDSVSLVDKKPINHQELVNPNAVCIV